MVDDVTTRTPHPWRNARDEIWIYLCNVGALLWPGVGAPDFAVNKPQAAATGLDWSTEDLQLLVDEGRRQLDRQLSELEHVRGRAQFLFTTTLAAFAVAVGLYDDAAKTRGTVIVLGWCLSVLFLSLAVLGAGAIGTVRADFGRVDKSLISQQQAPVLRTVADAYARAVVTGENTVATRLTMLRDAVLLLLAGFAIQCTLWLTLG